MNFKQASRFLLLTSAVVFLFCAPAQAQVQQGDPQGLAGAAPVEGVGSLKERLNLTPEQLQQIREIRSQNETEVRALVRRINQARRALDEAIYAEQADEPLIEQRAKELADAVGAATRMRAQVEWRIRRVLTPEQLNTLRAMRQQARRERIEKRRQQNPRRPTGDALNAPPNRDAAAPPANPLRRLRRRGILSRP